MFNAQAAIDITLTGSPLYDHARRIAKLNEGSAVVVYIEGGAPKLSLVRTDIYGVLTVVQTETIDPITTCHYIAIAQVTEDTITIVYDEGLVSLHGTVYNARGYKLTKLFNTLITALPVALTGLETIPIDLENFLILYRTNKLYATCVTVAGLNYVASVPIQVWLGSTANNPDVFTGAKLSHNKVAVFLEHSSTVDGFVVLEITGYSVSIVNQIPTLTISSNGRSLEYTRVSDYHGVLSYLDNTTSLLTARSIRWYQPLGGNLVSQISQPFILYSGTDTRSSSAALLAGDTLTWLVSRNSSPSIIVTARVNYHSILSASAFLDLKSTTGFGYTGEYQMSLIGISPDQAMALSVTNTGTYRAFTYAWRPAALRITTNFTGPYLDLLHGPLRLEKPWATQTSFASQPSAHLYDTDADFRGYNPITEAFQLIATNNVNAPSGPEPIFHTAQILDELAEIIEILRMYNTGFDVVDHVWLEWGIEGEPIKRSGILTMAFQQSSSYRRSGSINQTNVFPITLTMLRQPLWESVNYQYIHQENIYIHGQALTFLPVGGTAPAKVLKLWLKYTTAVNSTPLGQVWLGFRYCVYGASTFSAIKQTLNLILENDTTSGTDIYATDGNVKITSFVTVPGMARRVYGNLTAFMSTNYTDYHGQYLLLVRVRASTASTQFALQLLSGYSNEAAQVSEVVYYSATDTAYTMLPLGLVDIPAASQASGGFSNSIYSFFQFNLYAQRLAGVGSLIWDNFVLIPAHHMVYSDGLAMTTQNELRAVVDERGRTFGTVQNSSGNPSKAALIHGQDFAIPPSGCLAAIAGNWGRPVSGQTPNSDTIDWSIKYVQRWLTYTSKPDIGDTYIP